MMKHVAQKKNLFSWSNMSLKVRIGILAGIATVVVGTITIGRVVYAAGINDRDKVTHSQLDDRLKGYVQKDSFDMAVGILLRTEKKVDRLILMDKSDQYGPNE